MPHLVILYTPNIERETDMTALCRTMADAMLEQRDDEGRQVYPTGGTRVLAFPAAHHAVADGKGDYAFVYLNVRMATGRSEAVKKRIGDALLERVKTHFEPLLAKRHVGITLQIDEAPGQVYDGKCGNLHPLFNK
ncbi:MULTISPECIES: 5-carboxymethyl-2-hydroxymuconate Delta-isomerase [unclassified Variovorax]|uniref:5-carboxymethyl-2-hydroxymuconate Delta-isomerase n=1 Tax=unclassified Variovorax TaxID=663243 RepID=UPI0008925E1D|nr:5-carboxymethyl-2-hydroxymuconate Delta-isomerase [Variovorax sp. CF079]SDC76103.1 5-carboxymethyl-2-hydroxymuconate isomerase [Variovorax sp. CF079]